MLAVKHIAFTEICITIEMNTPASVANAECKSTIPTMFNYGIFVLATMRHTAPPYSSNDSIPNQIRSCNFAATCGRHFCFKYEISNKEKILEEIDMQDPDDRHYIRKKSGMDNRLYKEYDKIEELENQLIKVKARCR